LKMMSFLLKSKQEDQLATYTCEKCRSATKRPGNMCRQTITQGQEELNIYSSFFPRVEPSYRSLISKFGLDI